MTNFALLQTNIAFCDPEANFKRVRELFAQAMAKDPRPDVVVLPEDWSAGFSDEMFHHMEDFVEPENGPSVTVLRELAQAINAMLDRINEAYRKRSMATDKKGNPLIAMGEVVWKTEKDSARASRHLIVEALQFPNLKDKELMDFYHCVDVTDMPLKVFPKPDEYQHVSRMVMQALGLASAVNDDEELEAAKNS